MKIGTDLNLCKLCFKQKEQGYITVSSPEILLNDEDVKENDGFT
jgi:hypothetical protein